VGNTPSAPAPLVDNHSIARRLGLSALATVETVPLPHGHGFPRWHPAARLNRLVLDLHRLNVLATYRDLERQPTAA
jgi:hypothetical protein